MVTGIRIILLLHFVILLNSQAGLINAESTPDPVFLNYDSNGLARIKNIYLERKTPALVREINGIVAEAEKMTLWSTVSVIEKTDFIKDIPRNAFVTASTYYWKTDTGYERRDGQTNPEVMGDARYDRSRLDKLANVVNHSALAYYFTGNEKFAATATRFIHKWFINPETRMIPDLYYTEIIPGLEYSRSSGIINGRPFIEITEGIHLIRTSKSWSPENNSAVRAWYGDLAIWLKKSPKGIAEAEKPNNIGTWYDVQLITYALFAGDTRVTADLPNIVEKVKLRISTQIRPDGIMPLEMGRGTSKIYMISNFDAFVKLAVFGKHLGIDLLRYQTNDGSGILKTAAFMRPYISLEKKWPKTDAENTKYKYELICSSRLAYIQAELGGNAFESAILANADSPYSNRIVYFQYLSFLDNNTLKRVLKNI
jgi:hypothetical protein